MDGNEACAEGAIAAGCRFVSGYPITPSTEVVEHIAARFPGIGGMFVQMEDELGASICFQGAVWCGVKGMTVTSGPGFSLMMEHVGFAAMTETPSVFVNVQRAGPSTGLPTAPAQQDMQQARWGSHGDYRIIALSPGSPQACFDLTVVCFNLAETYRCPVFLMMDETVGHMHGKVVIPPAEDIHVVPRKLTALPPGTYQPYAAGRNEAPPMSAVGQGHRLHVTGLTHDVRGYPDTTDGTHAALVTRLCDKVGDHVDDIFMVKQNGVRGSDMVVIAYGITSRIVEYAVDLVRNDGIDAGWVQLVTIWPFNDAFIRDIAAQTKRIVMVELNMGQILMEVERVVANAVPVHFVGSPGGRPLDPETIVNKMREVMQ